MVRKFNVVYCRVWQKSLRKSRKESIYWLSYAARYLPLGFLQVFVLMISAQLFVERYGRPTLDDGKDVIWKGKKSSVSLSGRSGIRRHERLFGLFLRAQKITDKEGGKRPMIDLWGRKGDILIFSIGNHRPLAYRRGTQCNIFSSLPPSLRVDAWDSEN